VAPWVDEFQVRISLPLAHFEEALDDEEEFFEIGRSNSVTLHTLVRDLFTVFLADEHCLRNCYLPKESIAAFVQFFCS
jgi:hypothetical protein